VSNSFEMSSSLQISVLREIAPEAKIDPSARIGPFCVIGPEVTIGPRTVLAQRVTVLGATTIGADNVIEDGCVLGALPQDLKFHGRRTYLSIGDRNRFGPRVTAHVGTEVGGFLTRIGNDNVLESGAHVAHDCYVDDRVHMCPQVLLAGHIRVQTGATIEAQVGVHHFSTLGAYCRVGARTPVRRDVPPFTFFTSYGYYSRPPAIVGVNAPGLAAAKLPPRQRDQVCQAIAYLFTESLAMAVKLTDMLARPELPEPVLDLCNFCKLSLSGQFGRYREVFRKRLPPEARQYLPAAVLAEIEEARL
jgi:UDP-N-acetylglucosamine acyltransferase